VKSAGFRLAASKDFLAGTLRMVQAEKPA